MRPIDEIAQNMMPIVKVNAFLARHEGPDGPVHWHSAECFPDGEGHPAVLVVFHVPELRDQLYEQMAETVKALLTDMLGQVVPGPERAQ